MERVVNPKLQKVFVAAELTPEEFELLNGSYPMELLAKIYKPVTKEEPIKNGYVSADKGNNNFVYAAMDSEEIFLLVRTNEQYLWVNLAKPTEYRKTGESSIKMALKWHIIKFPDIPVFQFVDQSEFFEWGDNLFNRPEDFGGQ